MKLIQSIFIILITGFIMMSCNSTQDNNAMTDPVMETILGRTSIREYSGRAVASEIVEELLRAGMAAPSSRDRRPWHFIVVSNRETLEFLGNELKTAAALKNADKAIIVAGDTVVSDNCWFLDCSAVVQNILLAAHSKGLGAVWSTIYPYDDRQEVVKNYFDLPDNIKALAVIPLGYPKGKTAAKDKYDASRIHYNSW